MGINDWSESDKQLFAIGSRAALDDLQRTREEWNANAALDTTATDVMMREHNARVRELEEQHKAWMASYIKELTGDTAHERPGIGDREDASASPSRAGHGSRSQDHTDPREHELELERARTIAQMPMDEYARRRAELGVRSPTDMSHLFGATP